MDHYFQPRYRKRRRKYRSGQYPLHFRNPDDLETLEKMVRARQLYQQGVSLTEIRRRLKANYRTIKSWVEDIEPLEDPRIEQAREFYQQGTSLREIKRRLKAGVPTIQRWVADLIPEVDPRIEEARDLYQQGTSLREIERCLKADRITIKKWIADIKPPEDPRIEQARDLYQQGVSLREIGRRLKANYHTIKGWIANLEPPEDPRIQQVRILYQQGTSLREIIRRFKIGYPTIKRWIADLLPKKHYLRRRNPDDLEKLEKMVRARELYQQGASINKISRRLNACHRIIKRWVADIELPEDPRIQLAQNLYQQGASIEEIKRHLKAAPSTIKNWIVDIEPPEDPRIEQARDLYRQGASIEEIKRRLKADHSTIKKWMAGIEPPEDPRKEEARDLYRQGISINKIIRRLKADYHTIKRWIADIEPPEDPRIEQARELYRQGASIEEIERRLKANRRTFKKWIADIEPPADPRIERARELYQQGATLKEIKHHLNARHSTIKKWVADLLPKKHYLRRRNPDDLETLEKIAQARNLYQSGRKVVDIARLLRVSEKKVYSWISDIRTTRTRAESKKLKAQARKIFLELPPENRSAAEVARILGLPYITVNKWVRDMLPRKQSVPDLKQDSIALAEKYGNIKQAAEELGISIEPIYRHGWNKLVSSSQGSSKTDLYQPLYDEGLTDREIATKVGRSAATVANWRRKKGLPPNGDSHKSHLYQKLYNEGFTDEQIAEKVGRTKGAIYSWRRRKGLPSNPPASEGAGFRQNPSWQPDPQYQQWLDAVSQLLEDAIGMRREELPADYMWGDTYEAGFTPAAAVNLLVGPLDDPDALREAIYIEGAGLGGFQRHYKMSNQEIADIALDALQRHIEDPEDEDYYGDDDRRFFRYNPDPVSWAYQSGRICKSCGAESGPDKPFHALDMCAACYTRERGYREGLVCKSCGVESGLDKLFDVLDMCKVCSSRERAYQKGLVCKSCGMESGDDKPFSALDMCTVCWSNRRAYKEGLVCKSCGVESGPDKPFGKLDMCSACCNRKRAYREGLVCKSCGVESGPDKPFGKLDMCKVCVNREYNCKKKGWPSICVAGIHVPPPPREVVYAEKISHRLRDYPACDCYIDENNNIVPDPEIRYIPETDQPDPSRNYSPLRERRLAMGLGPKRKVKKFDPTGRKGSSRKSPRRSTRGGSSFDIGPRRPNPNKRKQQKRKQRERKIKKQKIQRRERDRKDLKEFESRLTALQMSKLLDMPVTLDIDVLTQLLSKVVKYSDMDIPSYAKKAVVDINKIKRWKIENQELFDELLEETVAEVEAAAREKQQAKEQKRRNKNEAWNLIIQAWSESSLSLREFVNEWKDTFPQLNLSSFRDELRARNLPLVKKKRHAKKKKSKKTPKKKSQSGKIKPKTDYKLLIVGGSSHGDTLRATLAYANKLRRWFDIKEVATQGPKKIPSLPSARHPWDLIIIFSKFMSHEQINSVVRKYSDTGVPIIAAGKGGSPLGSVTAAAIAAKDAAPWFYEAAIDMGIIPRGLRLNPWYY